MRTTIRIIVVALIVSVLVYFLRGDPTVKVRNGQFYDAIEDDSEIQPMLRKAEADTEELLKEDPDRNETWFGHRVWGTKKRILKEKYGIDWRTPRELNPKVAYY